MHFVDDSDSEDHLINKRTINLQEAEFTEFKWLAIEEALDLYKRRQLELFPPQVFLLTYMMFKALDFQKLREHAMNAQRSPFSYLTEKYH
jgi:hypothetical protein